MQPVIVRSFGVLGGLGIVGLVAWSAVGHAAAPREGRDGPNPAACELATPKACLDRGLAILEDATRAREAVPWVVKACDAGEGDGCAELGFMYMQGIGVAVDDAKAFAASTQACNLGSGLGCANAAVLVRDGRGAAADDRVMTDFADRGCKLGEGEACYLLAAIFDEGRGQKKDDAKAFAFLERACEHGQAQGCEVAGHRYYQGGRGAPKDVARAIKRLERACALGRGAVCTMLGVSFFEGDEGIARDVKRALELFKQGCALKDEDACKNQKLAEEGAATGAGAAREGGTQGKLGARQGMRATLTVTGEAPPVGAEGDVTKQATFAGFETTLTIGRARVTKVTPGARGATLELQILGDQSEIVVDGKKVNHWAPGVTLSFQWKAP